MAASLPEQLNDWLSNLYADVFRTLGVKVEVSLWSLFVPLSKFRGDDPPVTQSFDEGFACPTEIADLENKIKSRAEQLDSRQLNMFAFLGIDSETAALGNVVNNHIGSQPRVDAWMFDVGNAVRVGLSSMVVVVQAKRSDLDSYPSVSVNQAEYTRTVRFLECIITEGRIMAQAEVSSERPRRFLESPENVELLIRRAGRRFVSSLSPSRPWEHSRLFDRLNTLSTFQYEGEEIKSKIVIGSPADSRIILQFKNPIPLGKPTWARKAVQMGYKGTAVLCDGENIIGLCQPSDNDVYVDLLGSQRWQVCVGGTAVLDVRFGLASLPKRKLKRDIFANTVRRVLGFSEPKPSYNKLWELVSRASSQKHGTTIVISSDASAEADRLGAQATSVEPVALSSEMIDAVTAIDGAVLVGTNTVCYAVGVILDGEATPDGDPARGARYNSALRYWQTRRDCVVLVISEDGHIDLFPRLRPVIAKTRFEQLKASVKDGKPGDKLALAAAHELYDYYMDYIEDRLMIGQIYELIASDRIVTRMSDEDRYERNRFDAHDSDVHDNTDIIRVLRETKDEDAQDTPSE